jgi:hypothetical protein
MSDPIEDYIASGGTSTPTKYATADPVLAASMQVSPQEQARRDQLADLAAGHPTQPERDAFNKWAGGMPKTQSAPTVAATPLGNADPLESFIASGGTSIALPRGGTTTPASVITVAPSDPKVQAAIAMAGPNNSALDETAANFLTGLGANIVGGYKGLAALATGGSMSDAANEVTKYQQEHTYQPQSEGGKAGVAAMASDYNPLNWIPNAAEWAGEKTRAGATALGASPETAAAAGTAVNVGVNVAPAIIGQKVGGAVREIGNAADVPSAATSGATASSVAPVLPAGAGSTVAATPVVTPPKPRMTYAEWQAMQKGSAAEPSVTKVTEEAAQPTQTVPASTQGVEAPIFTKPAKATAGQLPLEQQAQRAAVLQRIGAPDDIRASAVTGDMGQAATELQMSRLIDDPRGEILKARLAQERQALTDHGQNIVQSTGGTLGMDESDLQARGQTILAPVDALKDWFDNEISKQYGIARERAQGQPVSMNNTAETLGQDSTFQGNTDSLQLRKGAQARMKELGMTDDEGNIISSTVDQAENLRKYLNEQWSPKAGKAISALKDAIDDDVTSAAGEDTFAAARALRAARGVTLDDPNGIAKLIDQEGLNRSVYAAKVPDYVASLPPEQLSHIVDTLKKLPAGLQPLGDSALAEIKAQFANKALQTGNSTAVQWNAEGVANYLSKNAEKLNRVFTPEELAPFKDLNDAGNTLHIDPTYPGSYVQQANLMKRGVIAALPAAGAGLGGTLGGLAGSVVGATPIGAGAGALAGKALGGNISEKIAARAAMQQVQRGTVKLSDFPNVGGR